MDARGCDAGCWRRAECDACKRLEAFEDTQPQVFYHCSPRENRESISTLGILARDTTEHGWPDVSQNRGLVGVFVHSTPLFWVGWLSGPVDVWEIDAEDLPVEKDRCLGDSGARCITANVSPRLIALAVERNDDYELVYHD